MISTSLLGNMQFNNFIDSKYQGNHDQVLEYRINWEIFTPYVGAI